MVKLIGRKVDRQRNGTEEKHTGNSGASGEFEQVGREGIFERLVWSCQRTKTVSRETLCTGSPTTTDV